MITQTWQEPARIKFHDEKENTRLSLHSARTGTWKQIKPKLGLLQTNSWIQFELRTIQLKLFSTKRFIAK